MNEMGLFGKRKKQKYHSYIGEVGRIAENIINRDFISDGPNKKRIGRLLIPLWLKNIGYLNYPLLYLSLYFKQNRTEYYGLLMDVRFKGKYEEWLKFFLKGIIEMSKNSIQTINKITALKNEVKNKIDNLKVRNKEKLVLAMNYIFSHPYFDSTDLRKSLNVTKPTVSNIVSIFCKLNIVSPVAEKQRYVTYRFNEYITLLEEGTEI